MKNTRLKMTVPALACLLALGLCSCSSSDEELPPAPGTASPVINLKGHTKDVRVGTRDLTLEFTAHERHGAAVQQGSYEHMLDMADVRRSESPMLTEGHERYDRRRMYENAVFTPIETAVGKKKSGGSATSVRASSVKAPLAEPWYPVLDFMGSGSARDYSVYSLSRWERFCDNGRNMDSRDWKFVRENRNAFPAELKEKCVPPGYAQLKRHGMVPDTAAADRAAYGKARK